MARISKIVLVEPRAPGYHVFSRVRLPRLGLPLLAAILKQLGYPDVTIYCEDIAPINYGELLKADLVGISTTTSTAPTAYRLGNFIKRTNPQTTVVVGGVHVTFMPQEPFDELVRRSFGIDGHVCDYVIRGEAEQLLPQLLQALENGQQSEPILGETRRPGPDQRISSVSTICDLDSLPLPDVASIEGHRRMHIAPVATSRGCPFDCNFCSVIEMFGQKVRYRSIDPDHPRSVIAELRNLRRFGMYNVFFYDDNFLANMARTKQLLENMIRANVVPKAWSAQVRATDVIRDRELLELMRQTNCVIAYMGLESINPQTLKAYNKRQNVEQITEAVHRLREYGVRTHGMFVFGADEDTVESLRATADFAIRHDISTVQFLILTPLPGTRCFNQLHEAGRIFDYDWGHYDAHHTVFWPIKMSPQELQRVAFEGMARVYAYSRCARPLLRGDWMTAFFRLYAHQLLVGEKRRKAEYISTLPRNCRRS